MAGSSNFAGRSPDSAAFEQLWQAIRAGRSTEYRQLVGDCTPHLLKVVRKRLDRRLRNRFDSLDFTQAVWLSFVSRIDCLPEFHTADELRGYLGQMATHKVIDEVRRHFTGQRRNIARESPLLDDEAPPPTTAPRSTPSQFAMANERLQQLLSGRSPVHQQIIRRKLEGETVANIAQAVGLSERQVRRVLFELESELVEPTHAARRS